MRGQIFQARFAWLKANHGPAGIEAALSALSEDERRQLRGLERERWYSFATLLRLDRAIAERLAPGDPHIFERLGEASSRERTEWLGEHATLVSVHGFLSRAAEDHRAFHSFGTAVYRRAGFNGGELEYRDYPLPDANWCLTSVGYIRAVVSFLTSGPARVVERRCQARGEEFCLFDIRWGEAGQA